MEISIRKIGKRIVEMTIVSDGTTVKEDVTNLIGDVDEKLIHNLREIADELENHNKSLNED